MDNYKLKRLMRILAVKSAYARQGALVTKEWVHVFFMLDGITIKEEDYKRWNYNLTP